MTVVLTPLTDKFSVNDADGYKRMAWSVSCVNPYSTGGEALAAFSGVFPNQILGGRVMAVAPGLTADKAGILSTGIIVADPTTSTAATASTTPVLQFFNQGLGATAQAGLPVDNTVANLSSCTCTLWATGR